MDIRGKKILFLGDSITEGVGVKGPEETYWALLGKEYGATVRGYGIGGTRFARQHIPSAKPRHDLNFCDRVAQMEPDADVVVVFGGTNDYGHGDAPLGSPADRTYDTFYGACHTLFSRLIERYPAALILVMTPLHRADEEVLHTDRHPTDAAPLATYVHMIQEVAAYYSLPVLDLFAAGNIQPTLSCQRERFVPDGLHPNQAGHAIIARKLAAFLATL